MTTIQEAVEAYIAETNSTKEALAKKLGMGRTSLFSKLRGASEFSLEEAYLLSRELEVTLDQLYAMIPPKAVA